MESYFQKVKFDKEMFIFTKSSSINPIFHKSMQEGEEDKRKIIDTNKSLTYDLAKMLATVEKTTTAKKTLMTHRGKLFLHMPQTILDGIRITWKRQVE